MLWERESILNNEFVYKYTVLKIEEEGRPQKNFCMTIYIYTNECSICSILNYMTLLKEIWDQGLSHFVSLRVAASCALSFANPLKISSRRERWWSPIPQEQASLALNCSPWLTFRFDRRIRVVVSEGPPVESDWDPQGGPLDIAALRFRVFATTVPLDLAKSRRGPGCMQIRCWKRLFGHASANPSLTSQRTGD